MAGIKLDFTGDKAVVAPQKLPLCMGWIPCENLIERIDTECGKEIHRKICKVLDMSVHEVFDYICVHQTTPCPKGLWYNVDESWYYKVKKSEKESV